MKFEELKNNLKIEIKNAYLLSGVDEFLLASAYALITKFANLEYIDLNLIEFKEGVIDCEDVVRALNTLPVFCDKKIVYLDVRVAKASDIKNGKLIDEYLKSPNPTSILVVNMGSNSAIKNFDTKLFTIVDCDRLSFNIVSLKIKQLVEKDGKKIGSDAIKLLNDYTLGDLSKIIVEIKKLCAYVGDRSEIACSDIKELVTPSLEYQIFELTEALSKKDSKKVFAILDDMKAKKDEFRTLPAIIFSHFRRLFMVALNADMSRQELSQLLGVKEYAVKMTLAQVSLFTKSQLKKINELCIKTDFDLKQSNISIENAVSLIIMNILNM